MATGLEFIRARCICIIFLPPAPLSYNPIPQAGYPAWGRSRGKDYSKHRCLDFPWVVKNCLIYLKSPLKTNRKQSFCSEECEVTVCGAKLICHVFNIPVDCFRLDKINILDTPSLFPVTVPANNRSCQEAASPRCQLNQEAVYSQRESTEKLYTYLKSGIMSHICHTYSFVQCSVS